MYNSPIYKKFYPIRSGANMSVLDEKERRSLAACVSQSPANMRTLHIRYVRSTTGIIRTGGKEKSELASTMAHLAGPVFLKRAHQVADKIKSGACLSSEDVELINLALFTDRHGLLFVVIPAGKQIKDLALYLNEHPKMLE